MYEDFVPLLAWRFGTFVGEPDCGRLARALSAEILRDDIVPVEHRAALQAWRGGRHDPIAFCERFINERGSPCGH